MAKKKVIKKTVKKVTPVYKGGGTMKKKDIAYMYKDGGKKK